MDTLHPGCWPVGFVVGKGGTEIVWTRQIRCLVMMVRRTKGMECLGVLNLKLIFIYCCVD